MKIFFYCPFIAAGKGGMERVGTELSNAMQSRGHEIILGFDKRNDNKPKYNVVPEVKLFPWDKPYSQLKKILLKFNPDVFFVFNGGYRFIQFLAAVDNTNIPFAIQECTNPMRLRKDNWAKLRRISLGQASWERELVASAAVRIRQTMPSYVLSLPDYIRPQVRFFPNAVMPASKLANLSDGEHKKTIINIGGLKKVKNIFPLLEAFKKISKEFPMWRIKVYGGGFKNEKSYQDSIHSFVKINGLENQIFFEGETDFIYDAYATSQIHVITSKDEGRPTCVCEAMCHGLPSIGFNSTPGVNELIRQNENGILVDYKKEGIEAFSKKLSQLMSDNEMRQRLGKKAYENSKEFIPKKVYEIWEKFFNEAAKYKNNIDLLFKEQAKINSELAFHALRMRKQYLTYFKD